MNPLYTLGRQARLPPNSESVVLSGIWYTSWTMPTNDIEQQGNGDSDHPSSGFVDLGKRLPLYFQLLVSLGDQNKLRPEEQQLLTKWMQRLAQKTGGVAGFVPLVKQVPELLNDLAILLTFVDSTRSERLARALEEAGLSEHVVAEDLEFIQSTFAGAGATAGDQLVYAAQLVAEGASTAASAVGNAASTAAQTIASAPSAIGEAAVGAGAAAVDHAGYAAHAVADGAFTAAGVVGGAVSTAVQTMASVPSAVGAASAHFWPRPSAPVDPQSEGVDPETPQEDAEGVCPPADTSIGVNHLIQLHSLDVEFGEQTLNRMIEKFLPKSDALRSLYIELVPGLVRVTADVTLPVLGARKIEADLAPTIQGSKLFLKLERASIPLIPKRVIVGAVAGQVAHPDLQAEGDSLIVDLRPFLTLYEVELGCSRVIVDQGRLRLVSGAASEAR
ncbi:MAG: hypothetical protein WCL39_04940 [Armatimonadota bacterium]